jgi:hypothetical protein
LKVQRTVINFHIAVRCTFVNSRDRKFYKYFAALLLFTRKF